MDPYDRANQNTNLCSEDETEEISDGTMYEFILKIYRRKGKNLRFLV